jgi:hypothetical protein
MTNWLGSLYLLPLLVMTSNSSQAVIHVAAALSQVYEEPLHMAISFAHCALQFAPSAVVGLKLLPAAQPATRRPMDNNNPINFTGFPFMVMKNG